MFQLRICFNSFFFLTFGMLQAQNLGFTPYYKKLNTHVINVNKIDDKEYMLFSCLSIEYDFGGIPQLCELSKKNEVSNCLALRPEYGYFEATKFNDTFLILGHTNSHGTKIDSLLIEVRNSDFKIISSKLIAIGKFVDVYRLIINDSIRVFTYSLPQGGEYNLKEFVFPKTLSLDSITQRAYKINIDYVSNLISDGENSGYVAYYTSGIYHVDKSFNKLYKSDSLVNVNNGFVIPAIDSGFVSFGGAIDYKTKSSVELGITMMDKNLHYIKGDIFGEGPSSYEYPGMKIPIDADKDNYYVTGMIGIQDDIILLGKKSTYFYVAKYDKAINRIWLKKYGGERHYGINSVYATGDGGCCIYGFVRDSVNDFVTTPFIMCFDEQGETSSYTVQNPPKEKLFELKGNLIQYNFTLANTNNSFGFGYELYDVTGRIMLKGSLSLDESLIDSSSLPSGIYFMVIKDSQQAIKQTEKLIKY